jgi:hypothetical protein
MSTGVKCPLDRDRSWANDGMRAPPGAGPGLDWRGCDHRLRGGCLEGDFEAELFELGDEAAGSPVGVFAGGEVVVA